MSKESNTTGTISGDLEKVRREHAAEMNLRLARLGPISKFVFNFGHVGIGVLQLALMFAIGFGIWDFTHLPISPEWLELGLRGFLACAIAAGASSAAMDAFDDVKEAWLQLWLPPRH